MSKKRKNTAGKEFQKKRAAKTPPKEEQKKIKLLYHGDSPKVNTGFGVVAREVLSRLNATGKYDIYCVGINDQGDPSQFEECNNMVHYPLPGLREDPYGIQKLPMVMKNIQPDVVFTLNDIWVLDGDPDMGTQGWFMNAMQRFAPNVPWVFYFPVDSRPWTESWAALAFSADKTIVYSKYAAEVLQEINPKLKPEYIPHGVTLERFNVLDFEERKQIRKSISVEEDNFLLGFVSRNQPRKNPAAVLEIFKMANEGYRKCTTCESLRNLDDPKCEYCGEDNKTSVEHAAVLEGKGKIYLHFNLRDNMGLDIYKIMNDNSIDDGVIFNPNHSIPFGLPAEQFNSLFNALDCHLLTTLCEGFGLTVLEGMACGVPTMATRTTAVTELIDEGRGIPIIPRGHIIMKDAANTRKHLIDPERTIFALKDLYEDWKKRDKDERWGPETKVMVDKALEFCKGFTWDQAAQMFDEKINEAIDNRVSIIDQFTDDENKKFMFMRKGNAGDILQTMPAVDRFIRANQGSEFVYAMPENLIKIFKDKCPKINKIIPIERMNDKNPEERTVKINIFNMQGPEERYEKGAYPFLDRSRPEIYCIHAGVEPFEVSLSGLFTLTAEEMEVGKTIYEEQVGEMESEKFVVGLAPLTLERRHQWGNGYTNWDKLTTYLEKMKMGVIKLDQDHSLEENLAAFKLCNLVVSVDSDILDFLHALDIPTIALISPYWKIRVKGFENCRTVTKDDYAQMGMYDNLEEPNTPSRLIDDIGVGEVFSPILTYQKAWKQARKEIKEKEQEADTGSTEEATKAEVE
jgi:glycosyltransferase involved in cell wall biosynthesis